MRVSLALSAFAIAFAAAHAEQPRRTGTVEIDGVEIRAGHALGFPAVGQLRKGDSVIIIREEETGFFAIQPPAGSASWIKQIHLAKVEFDSLVHKNDLGEKSISVRANVPVSVEGAEVMAGIDKENKPTNRVTARLPKGTIVEVTGQAVRVENSTWYPISPPEGDLRWVPKAAIRSASLTALGPPPPYVKPEGSPFTVGPGGTRTDDVAKPAATKLPLALTEHKLWARASEAEKSGDNATARSLYARIYQDLWEQKAERDAIVICYNRYTRCDEAVKKGEPAKPDSRTDNKTSTPTSRSSPTASKWSSAGYLQELQKVFVDGQQVYSFQDERGNVMYYVTSVSGINLKNYNNKRVQLYGPVETRPELYRPHLAAERVELAK